MNAEHLHQIYGGEVSDYHKIYYQTPSQYSKQIDNGDQLTDIYNSQVKSKGSVDLTNSVLGFNPKNLIEYPTKDPTLATLQDTLNSIAYELNLADKDSSINTSEYSPVLRGQTSVDMQQASDAVQKALDELRSLGEL